MQCMLLIFYVYNNWRTAVNRLLQILLVGWPITNVAYNWVKVGKFNFTGSQLFVLDFFSV